INKYGKDKIVALFLCKTNRDKLIKDFAQSNTPNDWILERTKNKDDVFPKIADMISTYSQYFQIQAKRYNFRAFNMDKDFIKQIKKAIDYLITND
ncbi:MAG: hypothetical protein U9Q16_02560, partial [Patescibacteria group bacterium]|nr:hypothetical protein [Patescibacteria group bacterium]